ncbi:MAG TPA: GNAT family N-acetyltransferase [Acidimicrobiales bacterium]
MEFSRVDPISDDQFDAWFGVLHRSELERDEGGGGGWLPSEWRARALDESAPVYHQLFSYGDDLLHPVAVAALEVTRDDNLHWIRGELFVDPLERRKGYGSAALLHLEATALDLQRPALLFWVMEGGRDVKAPNRAFAPRHGYVVVEENVRRELDWPRPDGQLDRLFKEWSPRASAYDILTWRGPTPEELLSERAHLSAVMPLEVPSPGFDYEEEKWDNERVRIHEKRTHEMGRDLLVAVARERTRGTLVGFSELSVSREQPGTAYQWDTLVLGAHRGHRLGGLMKIATMRLLGEGGYATKRISTSNSAVNTPMIAVNEQLGAVVSGGIVTWRKELS